MFLKPFALPSSEIEEGNFRTHKIRNMSVYPYSHAESGVRSDLVYLEDLNLRPDLKEFVDTSKENVLYVAVTRMNNQDFAGCDTHTHSVETMHLGRQPIGYIAYRAWEKARACMLYAAGCDATVEPSLVISKIVQKIQRVIEEGKMPCNRIYACVDPEDVRTENFLEQHGFFQPRENIDELLAFDGSYRWKWKIPSRASAR